MKSEKEFLKIAKDMEEGYCDPYTIHRKDMYGKEKEYSYTGDIWYSCVWNHVKHFTTPSKRDRAYDYVYSYLVRKGFNIHS